MQKSKILLMAEILHQLRWVVYPITYRVLYILGGARFLPSTVFWKCISFQRLLFWVAMLDFRGVDPEKWWLEDNPFLVGVGNFSGGEVLKFGRVSLRPVLISWTLNNQESTWMSKKTCLKSFPLELNQKNKNHIPFSITLETIICAFVHFGNHLPTFQMKTFQNQCLITSPLKLGSTITHIQQIGLINWNRSAKNIPILAPWDWKFVPTFNINPSHSCR